MGGLETTPGIAPRTIIYGGHKLANVSVAIILISAAAAIGIFKQTYKIIWTVLLA